MLEKLSCDAVKPDQLAQVYDIGLSQPLRPAQGPGGAEVEWWKLGNIVLGRACSIEVRRRAQGTSTRTRSPINKSDFVDASISFQKMLLPRLKSLTVKDFNLQ